MRAAPDDAALTADEECGLFAKNVAVEVSLQVPVRNRRVSCAALACGAPGPDHGRGSALPGTKEAP